MKKQMIIWCIVGCFMGCAPVNHFTRLEKLPRECSANYAIEGIKAPKSEIHKKPWIVYSDRAGNATYVNPGGKIKSVDAGFLDPFLVIGTKGDYLRLIKYKPDNIKNNRLTEYKKAEYAGWIHRSRLILFPTSVTDIRSGQKEKLIAAITDTAAVMHPDRYFVEADLLKVYGEPDLQKVVTSVGLGEILYAVKTSADGANVLVARTSDFETEKIKEQIVGWLPWEMLHDIGRHVFVKTSLAGETEQPKTLKYSPVISPYFADSACTFSSGVFLPLIDKSENRVYNVDGESISYPRALELKRDLRNINILFSMESGQKLSEQYPMLLNIIQNLRPLFSALDDPFRYRFGAGVAVGKRIVTIPMTSDYNLFIDTLTGISSGIAETHNSNLSAWSVLGETLRLIDGHLPATNLIITIGESGGPSENASSSILSALKEKNCRLLGWQLYASEGNQFNDFVLQLGNMINNYAEFQKKDKRQITLYADQLCHENQWREAGSNFFVLDYPKGSMTQGGFLFPEKEGVLPLELFAGAVDSLLTQIRADNNLLSESIDRAFATVGNAKDRFDPLLVGTYHLPKGIKPDKEFKKVFDGVTPLWYREIPQFSLPDSLMQYRLMLSEDELTAVKQLVEALCSKEVDVKNADKPRKGKMKDLCRYLEQMEHPDRKESTPKKKTRKKSVKQNNQDTVYVSTRKIRKHLQQFYLSELKSCRICHEPDRNLKRLTLSQAHRHIFGIPANHPTLEEITVKKLKKRRVLTDKGLDCLIHYFKEKKEDMDKKSTEEQVSSGGQNYYYIDWKLLP